MALDMEYLKRIDWLAYNRPEIIPDEIMRGDKIQYKILSNCSKYVKKGGNNPVTYSLTEEGKIMVKELEFDKE